MTRIGNVTGSDVPEPLAYTLRTYCNVNYMADDYPAGLKRYLEHPQFPGRAMQFRRQLLEAITHGTITPTQYEALTDDDRELPADLEQALRILWRDLYGDEPVPAPERESAARQ